MAKKKVEVNESKKEEKPYNKFQWFLFAIVIPVFFAIFILLIVLSVAGINVFKWSEDIGSKIPLVSNLVNDEKGNSEKDIQKQIVNLEGDIKDRDAEIEKLESIIDGKDSEIKKADIEKQRLEEEIKKLKENKPTQSKSEDNRAIKDIIRTYESMSPKKAAPIITALPTEEAMKILSNMKAETLAKILEQMAPVDAAKFTKQLTIESEKDNQAQ
ncbi:MotE family protein [Bacillus sp. JJ722]|uniref:MotE family protein n=1 Tax=Bacillus sp. JJ722 TaxID=3122973 RepID=UPI002FFF8E80